MKTLFWVKGIDEILCGSDNVKGISVQIAFWARTFAKNGHNVYCLTDYENTKIGSIKFERSVVPNVFVKMHLSLLYEFFDDLRILTKVEPDFVICRGSGRYLYVLSALTELLKIKLVFWGAHDVNFVPGKDIVNGSVRYTKLYRKSIKRVDYFITQNRFQADTLEENYRRNSLTLANVWMPGEEHSACPKTYDFIWVANLRKWKRAEWFIRAAVNHPDYKFAIAGGSLDASYYEEMKNWADKVQNLDFLGPQPFKKVNELISSSRVLCCTSVHEGFPNTFVQAWAHSVPVISTVNPSDVIAKNKLGILCSDEASFNDAVGTILKDGQSYAAYIDNIRSYFHQNHDADTAYIKLAQWIGLK